VDDALARSAKKSELWPWESSGSRPTAVSGVAEVSTADEVGPAVATVVVAEVDEADIVLLDKASMLLKDAVTPGLDRVSEPGLLPMVDEPPGAIESVESDETTDGNAVVVDVLFCAAVKTRGWVSIEDAGWVAVEDAGWVAVEDSGRAAVEDSGRAAVEDSGRAAVEDSGRAAVEDAGRAVVEDPS
jgi:hypothetical protein